MLPRFDLCLRHSRSLQAVSEMSVNTLSPNKRIMELMNNMGVRGRSGHLTS
jgi:hypothetical protein